MADKKRAQEQAAEKKSAQKTDNKAEMSGAETTDNKNCNIDAKEENTDKSELAQMQEKLAQAEEKLAKEHDSYVRLYAEFDNFRKRNAQEKLELVSTASAETIKGLLPVLDDCERAMKVLAESSDSEAAKEGTELIYSKLMAYLKGKGLAPIEAMGKPFDTELHEAIANFPVPEEEMKGKVFDVTQTGYTLNGKVIRYAKVVVGM